MTSLTGLVAVRYAWPRYQRAQRQAANRALWERCNRYRAPPDQVVYEEDPVLAQAIGRDPANYIFVSGLNKTWASHRPPPLQRAIMAASYSTNGTGLATLFFGERTGWVGERQLVIVQLNFTHSGFDSPYSLWSFRVTCILPAWTGDLGSGENIVTLKVPAKLNDMHHHVRFYAGQRDPADASHFTIRYSVDGRSGIIDGRVDVPPWPLELKVRNGPAATQPASE